MTGQPPKKYIEPNPARLAAFIKSNVNIRIDKNILTIKFREPFKPRRGRINCSLNDNGKWRWFGTQFVIKEN